MENAIKKQIRKEIEDTRRQELFLAYHGYNHALSRHLDISHAEMKQRIKKKVFKKEEIVSVTKFSNNTTLDQLSEMIYTCLLNNLDSITTWVQNGCCKTEEYVFEFPYPIGEGIVMGTNWNQLFPMSKINVVLEESTVKGRYFHILSAYPLPNIDEVDQIWNAKDEWQERRIRQ